MNVGNPDQPSLFFKCYSDDIYEAILEDLRSHYIAISNQDLQESEEEEPDMYDQPSSQYPEFMQYPQGFAHDIPAVGGYNRI